MNLPTKSFICKKKFAAMQKAIFPILVSFWVCCLSANAQLTLQISDIPDYTPLTSGLHLAGNFNNWNPGDEQFILEKTGNKQFVITIYPPAGQVEFKLTRGNWASVEGNADGLTRPNRSVQYNGTPQTVQIAIASWEDLEYRNPTNSTAAENVNFLSQRFAMPPLNRNRRIWIYLPPDYGTSDRRYPVLYMHDAQNLFDHATSFSGEWRVDETLNNHSRQTQRGVIVVGIDNGGGTRIGEYTPYPHPNYGGGEGEAYTDFIVETLKPYVDANYRTLPERQHTGIVGSSLGGLISLYAAIEHQDVFGMAGVLSPSLWFSDEIFNLVRSAEKTANMRIFLLAGEQEDAGSVVRDNQRMYKALRRAGFRPKELRYATHPDGQHSEWYWAREFPVVIEWLLANN